MSPSLRTRFVAWLARPDLDAELAAGQKPATPELRLRAAQLTARAHLSAVAQRIEAIVDQSNARDEGVVNFQQAEVVNAYAPLLRLAERLREANVPPTAAAIASQLVYSLRSPLYDRRSDRSVCDLATEALEMIDAAQTRTPA